jgi:hypothetical protein
VTVQTRPHPVTRVHRPPIRLRPAPRFDPPFDDEVGSELWLRAASDDQLMFDFAAPAAAADPTPASAPPPLMPSLPSPPPEGRRAAHRFANTCVEILNGFRPAGHLRALARPHHTELVVQQLADALGRLPAARPRAGRRPELLRLRMLRLTAPVDGVIEAAATLGTSARTWALAFRLERRTDNAWQGTTLHLL